VVDVVRDHNFGASAEWSAKVLEGAPIASPARTSPPRKGSGSRRALGDGERRDSAITLARPGGFDSGCVAP
jgi:hypothetical protein